MTRICKITGKKPVVGNVVSHSNNKIKRRFNVNLFNKRFYLSKNKKWIRIKVSAAGIKIINTIGIQKTLKKFINGKERKNK